MRIRQTQRDELVSLALKARERAYAPYSHYRVGAALLTEAGKIYVGVNVENAAYPTSMCAERTAVFKAVSEGDRSFQAIAVVSENGGSPCGGCRQVLAEFGPDVWVIIANGKGEVTQELPLAELLPAAFGPRDLETSTG